VDYCTAVDALALPHANKSKFAMRLTWLVDRWCQDHGEAFADMARSPGVGSLGALLSWLEALYGNVRNAVVHDGMLEIAPRVERDVGLWPYLALMAIAVVAENIDQWPKFADFEAAYQTTT